MINFACVFFLGTNMTYTRWAPNEPSDWEGEQSVELVEWVADSGRWLWNDVASYVGRHVVCELPFVFPEN